MIKRCFAFGCSFTNWYFWPTWADFIGLGYPEYYNFGMPGVSNKMMHTRFIEVDNFARFDENDLILIGVTNFGRYNWPEEIDGRLSYNCRGAPENWSPSKTSDFMANYIWQHKFGINETLQYILNVKRLLEKTGSRLYIIMAMDNNKFFDHKLFGYNNSEILMVEQIYQSVLNRYSLEEFSHNYGHSPNDNHPLPQAHFDFVQRKMPELLLGSKHQELLSSFKGKLECTKEQSIFRDGVFKDLNLRNNLTWKLYGGYH